MLPRWFGESRRTGFVNHRSSREDTVMKCALGDTQHQRANSPCSPAIVGRALRDCRTFAFLTQNRLFFGLFYFKTPSRKNKTIYKRS